MTKAELKKMEALKSLSWEDFYKTNLETKT